MPDHEGVLRPDTARVAARVIDGEAIIMDVRSGVYYSMQGTGSFVWEQIDGGATVQDIAQALARRYDVSPERALKDVTSLVEQLLQEGVVRYDDNVRVVETVAAPHSADVMPYQPPGLQVYRDMGDLLALDPPAPSVLDLAWNRSGDDEPR